jgi:hypothetical protein
VTKLGEADNDIDAEYVTKLGDAKKVADGYDLDIRGDFDVEEDTLGEGLCLGDVVVVELG